MKRSEINGIMREADAFIRSFGFRLPPFAHWTPEAFKARRAESRAIVDRRLGWDVTDFGLGRYAETGLFLFTLRNGHVGDLARGRGMLYAEKIMMVRRDQLCPMHRHNVKAEDIINRGGGTLVLELFSSDSAGGIDNSARIRVTTDGIERCLPPGGTLALAPGESVTLMPGQWHAFRGEGSDVLVGEVSTVNDDLTDNVFRDPIGRFPAIEEDEPPIHLLVGDYGALSRG